MIDVDLLTRLDSTYNMLARLAEDDIRSAYGDEVGSRPALPDYLDDLYRHIVRAVEFAGAGEELDAVSDFER